MKISTSLPWRRMAFALSVGFVAFASGHIVQTQSGPSVARAATIATPEPKVAEVPEPAAPVVSCETTQSVEAGIAGMLSVMVSAPCAPDGKITVSQGPLKADWKLDGTGTRHLSFAAIAPDHPLLIEWPNGKVTEHAVPETLGLPPYRTVLNWKGAKFLSLNAQEFGATTGTLGHIHASQTASPERAARGAGGFLMVLGDGSGHTAEVYTFPADQIQTQGVVRLTVSAPITLRTCGRQAVANAYQSDPFGGYRTSQVNVTLPECDAIGQTLVLKNLFRDLRLAAN